MDDAGGNQLYVTDARTPITTSSWRWLGNDSINLFDSGNDTVHGG